MGKKTLIVIGGGEHAHVVAEAAKNQWDILGYIDERESSLNYQFLGQDSDIHDIVDTYPSALFAWGIGSNAIRERLVKVLQLKEKQFANVIHPSSIISESALMGQAVFVAAGAKIQAGVHLHSHTIVNTGAIVDHDCVIKDFSHIAPGAVIGGGCIIGHGSFIGLGSCINDHIVIGDRVTVGAGSVVIKNVRGNSTVVGSPAKYIK